MPPEEVFCVLPWHMEMLHGLCNYDLVGFQTSRDLNSFLSTIQSVADGSLSDNNRLRAFGRTLQAGRFPIGLDTNNVVDFANEHDNSEMTSRLKKAVSDRRLIIGVDRLDYSKGLYDRFEAFDKMLEVHTNISLAR